jgi:Zn-dependent protease with chaperone function
MSFIVKTKKLAFINFLFLLLLSRPVWSMDKSLDLSPKTSATEQVENIKDEQSQAGKRWLRAEKYFKTAFYWYADSLRGARWFIQGLGGLRSLLRAESLTTRYQNLATEMPIEHLRTALKKMGAPAKIPLLILPLEENHIKSLAQTEGNKVIFVTPELMPYFTPSEQSVTIGHEYIHLYYKHNAIDIVVNLALPFVTYFSLVAYDYLVRYCIHKLRKHYALDPMSKSNNILKLVAQMHHRFIVAFPLVNYLLNLYLYSRYSQHCEFIADLESANLLNDKSAAISSLMKVDRSAWEIILKQVKATPRKPAQFEGSYKDLLINLAFLPVALISFPILGLNEALPTFDDYLGCAHHPSIEQRINNLKTL